MRIHTNTHMHPMTDHAPNPTQTAAAAPALPAASTVLTDLSEFLAQLDLGDYLDGFKEDGYDNLSDVVKCQPAQT